MTRACKFIELSQVISSRARSLFVLITAVVEISEMGDVTGTGSAEAVDGRLDVGCASFA